MSCVYVGTAQVEEITVGTAEEFVNAIGPNRRVILLPGVYNLSEAVQIEETTDSVCWQYVKDYYGDAGVIEFEHCENISIYDAEIYGRGSIGLAVSDTSYLTCDSVDINHCSFKALVVRGSANIAFRNTYIHNHEAYSDVILVKDSESVEFDGCTFSDNDSFAWSFFNVSGAHVLLNDCGITGNNKATDTTWKSDAYFFEVESPHFGSGGYVTLRNTVISDNSCDYLTNINQAVIFENCTSSNNAWTKEGNK